MENGKFKLKTKEELEVMTFQERAKYFQDLMKELTRRDEELEQLNLGAKKRRGRASEKSTGSPGV